VHGTLGIDPTVPVTWKPLVEWLTPAQMPTRIPTS
jgi:hypothetical protein